MMAPVLMALGARPSPEGSRLPSYLRVCIARYRTCVHSRYVRYTCQSLSTGPRHDILLAKPRGAVGIYVSSCVGPI
jgi:hypothetical protein